MGSSHVQKIQWFCAESLLREWQYFVRNIGWRIGISENVLKKEYTVFPSVIVKRFNLVSVYELYKMYVFHNTCLSYPICSYRTCHVLKWSKVLLF